MLWGLLANYVMLARSGRAGAPGDADLRRVEDLLRRLPPNLRNVAELRLKGMGCEAVGRRLNQAAAVVAVLSAEAIALLKKWW